MRVDDGFSPGKGGAHRKETFEGEDGHFEEVEGEPGDEAGDAEGDDEADDLVILAGGGVADVGSEVVEDGFEEDMEDVKAIADASEPTEGCERKEGAGQAVAQDEGDRSGGRDADGG